MASGDVIEGTGASEFVAAGGVASSTNVGSAASEIVGAGGEADGAAVLSLLREVKAACRDTGQLASEARTGIGLDPGERSKQVSRALNP